eukprot:5903289-Pyramimonas_sp.AAC.1
MSAAPRDLEVIVEPRRRLISQVLLRVSVRPGQGSVALVLAVQDGQGCCREKCSDPEPSESLS